MDVPTPKTDTSAPSKSILNLPTDRRRIGDVQTLRNWIYDDVKNAASQLEPVKNARFTLSLHDVDYSGPFLPNVASHKKAVLEGSSLSRKLLGTWRLTDNNTGDLVDEKRGTLMGVPHLTDRGTFLVNGAEYAISNQLRLRPGIYARRKANGEIESHVNVSGKGAGHRLMLEPESGVFKVHVGQAAIPMLPILRALGATDDELKRYWGDKILAMNRKYDGPQHVEKFLGHIARGSKSIQEGETVADALKRVLGGMTVDPAITKKTLGKPIEALGKEAYLAATKKLLAISRGETQPDNRDHLAYQTVVGPEDTLAEYVRRHRPSLNQHLWKATLHGNLSKMKSGALEDAMSAAILRSGLAQLPEGINAAEFLDHAGRITRMGAGGLGTGSDSIPDESRDVDPSQAFFIDPVRTPESGSAGVDLRLAFGVHKGRDGRMYAPFRDPKSNRLVYRSPQQIADTIVAFPGELANGKQFVRAIKDNRLQYVDRKDVDLEAPSMDNAFGPLTNSIPMKASAKGQRLSMGSRYLSQALPLVNAEAPLVRSQVAGQPGASYEDLLGRHMGVVHAAGPGVVTAVSPDGIKVRYADGSTQEHPIYNHFPGPRKTGMHATPLVQPGDQVVPGQVLAKSNYTDAKGAAALGLNTRVAYLAHGGHTYEDAVVISESYAKRAASDHYYQHRAEFDDNSKTGKKAFVSLFPGTYDRKVLDTLDDEGTVKPGTVVQPGAPLVLHARRRELDRTQVTNAPRTAFSDSTLTWDHHNPGVVTDVVRGKSGVNVVVHTQAVTQVGDKFCYDQKTQILTNHGWKPIWGVTEEDEICSLVDGKIVYQKPTGIFAYPEADRMVRLRGDGVDLLVTDNHKLYCHLGDGNYQLMPAAEVVGRVSHHLKGATWEGEPIEEPLRLEPLSKKLLPPELYCKLLGALLANGEVREDVRSQREGSLGDRYELILRYPDIDGRELLNCGYSVRPGPHGWDQEFLVRGAELVRHFKPFAAIRRVPTQILQWSASLLRVLLYQLLRVRNLTPGLANDIQWVALHAGTPMDLIREELIEDTGNDTVVSRKLKLAYVPREVRATARFVPSYQGPVYCVEVPGHIVYVRRNGKAVWCGNSNRYGGKGVVAQIVPDEQMPHDKDGKPYEMLISPLSLLSRINPAWVGEAALGKVAEKTGQPYVLPDFQGGNAVAFAKNELAKHGLSDTEEVYDPVSGRKIPGVLTGNNFILRLHHQAESKLGGRGLGGQSLDGTPARGGPEGAKRMSLGDSNALLSHGALGVLRDSREHRSAVDNEFWLSYMGGFPTPHAKIPHVYEKFLNHLKGAGINVVREGPRLRLMAMTDKDVAELAGTRELQNADTVKFDKGLEPIPGGLFDAKLTGGHGGKQWSKITLSEPLPNPVFADPIRKLLGLTGKRYQEIIAGRDRLGDQTGPAAISRALEHLDIPKELARARQEIASARGGVRDAAIKRLSYLKSLERTGLKPGDWVLSAVPVLPPVFRPVATMMGGRGQLVSDPNVLYRELFDANQNLKHLRGKIADVGAERMTLYRALEAVVGLGDPVQPKSQERGVKGLLANLFGPTPKLSYLQQKLLGTSVNFSGRAVITPDPNLDMDHIGIPEDKAFDVYRPFLVRRLVRQGVPRAQALQFVMDRHQMARDALLHEMDERPVIVTRYPLLHKYGEMAFFPRLAHGDVIRMSPIVTKPYGADFDGNCVAGDTYVEIAIDVSVLCQQPVEYWVAWNALSLRLTGMPIDTVDALRVRMDEIPRLGKPMHNGERQLIYTLPEGIAIASYDPVTGAPVLSPVVKLTVDRDHPCVEVRTSHGLSVVVSDNESLCVYDGNLGTIRKVKPADAKGGFCPYVKKNPIVGCSYNRDVGWWYGALLADGWLADRTVGYAKLDDAKRAEFVRVARVLGFDGEVREYSDIQNGGKFGASKKLHLNSTTFRQQVMGVTEPDHADEGTRPACRKRIPEDLLRNGSRECLLGLLSGLLDGDATIGWNHVLKNKRFFAKFNTSSPYLRDGIRTLLRKLGVRSSVTTMPPHDNSREAYIVCPSIPDLARVLGECRLVGADARAAVEEFLRDAAEKPVRDPGDVVPVSAGLLQKVRPLAYKRDPSVYNAISKSSTNLTREMARRVVALGPVDHPHWRAFVDAVENEDVHWTRVVEVLPAPTQDVYDLEIPDTRVFALENGLVVYDTTSFHVPVDEEAINDAREKMLPSKNLFSAATLRTPLYQPNMEYVQGLHAASTAKVNAPVRVFATREDAIRAFRRGEIDMGHPVEILGK